MTELCDKEKVCSLFWVPQCSEAEYPSAAGRQRCPCAVPDGLRSVADYPAPYSMAPSPSSWARLFRDVSVVAESVLSCLGRVAMLAFDGRPEVVTDEGRW